MAASLADRFLALEMALANRDASAVPGGLEALIDDDFVEFGASGRRWTAAETRQMLRGGPPSGHVAIDALEAREVAPGIVLVTYRSGPERPALRSSLWVERDGSWSLVFHQGTPIPSP
jgi:hypothetical protein